MEFPCESDTAGVGINRISLDLLRKNGVGKKLFIFIDELLLSKLALKDDEVSARIALIRDLIRCIDQLNFYFVSNNLDIHIICSLRQNIRNEILKTNGELSKTIDGNGFTLTWGGRNAELKMREIILSKIQFGASPNLTKQEAENLLPETITFGNHNRPFDQFVVLNTWCKPRDIVRFLRCCKDATGDATRIDQDVIKSALDEYARISANEIFDEISANYGKAEIETLRKGIKRLQYNNLNDFVQKVGIRYVDIHDFSQTLFESGVIGNSGNQVSERRYYWFHRGDEFLDPEKKINIHLGLSNYFNIR